jgi:hypothetical protein
MIQYTPQGSNLGEPAGEKNIEIATLWTVKWIIAEPKVTDRFGAGLTSG